MIQNIKKLHSVIM